MGVVERQTEEEIARSAASNAAEAAARVPGVVVEGKLGEADRVLVWGAEARLVATTLNGERLPSPDGGAPASRSSPRSSSRKSRLPPNRCHPKNLGETAPTPESARFLLRRGAPVLQSS